MSANRTFTDFASKVARATGKPVTFVASLLLILTWAVTGPLFHYSDTWQLIINTGTTIVTFLMVFLIQNTQNRDGAAIQGKLDEIIRASAAQNHFIGIENLTEEELQDLRDRCAARGRPTKLDQAREAADEAEDAAHEKARRAADHSASLKM